MSEDISEIYRRLTVAAIHKAGTLIRKTELERAKMQAMPLLKMTEALERSLESVQPLQRFADLFKAKSDEEAIEGLFKLIVDVGSMPAYLEQIGKLVDSVNVLRDQLKKEGLIFEFPEITKPSVLEIAKLVTLPSIRGILKGIIEAQL